MFPDVLTFDPVLVERPWGGRPHATRDGSAGLIGERWEVADLSDGVAIGVDDPRSRVRTGSWAGAALVDIIAVERERLLGAAPPTPDGRFPLLVKLLDARQHLSVQVHPHAAYVAEHPAARLKTESWYVVRAESGADLFLDIVDGVPDADLRHALGTPDMVGLLGRMPAEPGDFHHLPAGIVHALGAGISVLEVQTPSDTTFRIYDWAEEYGREPRPLHLDEAAATIVRNDPNTVSMHRASSAGTRLLIETPFYSMREHTADGGRMALGRDGELAIVSVVHGEAMVGSVRLGPEETALVPASSPVDHIECAEGTAVVETRLA